MRELICTPTAGLGGSGSVSRSGSRKGELLLAGQAQLFEAQGYGVYADAIRLWENSTRPAPPPCEPTGRAGRQRISPGWVEWLMGLPSGWVSDVEVDRNSKLRLCGNAVVPQQASYAVACLLDVIEAVL